MYCIFETRNGWVVLARNSKGLTHCTLPSPSREDALESIEAGLSSDAVEDEAAFGDLPGKLRRYFDGERVDFSGVAVDVSGFGPCHAAAMLAAQKIPYGTLVTYEELARMAGNEKAARAAGSAMAGNPMPIIIPCHRVVAAGRRIGGFSAGLEWKRSLLELEGVDI